LFGAYILEEGIAVDPEKIETIKGRSHQGMSKHFMGLVGYCMKFIGGFSKIAHPITYL
jgi:hypothetical protein